MWRTRRKDTDIVAARRELARLLTDLCERRIAGEDLIKGVLRLSPQDDAGFDAICRWILDVFDPELQSPGFNVDSPPFGLQRQFALFRRFLLSNSAYSWPLEATQADLRGCGRLLLAAVSVLLSAACIVICLVDGMLPLSIVVAIAVVTFTVWFVLREPAASRRDAQRARQRAGRIGDPDAWPFMSMEDFRKVGPSRRQIQVKHQPK